MVGMSAVKAASFAPTRSPRHRAVVLGGGGRGHVYLVFLVNEVFGDGVERVTGDVDKVKRSFHTAGHAFQKTSQFLAYVIFECGSTPSAHLLDLRVGVPGQR